MQPLRDSENVRTGYSRRLDDMLKAIPPMAQVDMIEDQMVTAIRTAADEKIPPLHRRHEDKPWAGEEFLTLFEKRRKSFDTTEIKEESAQIRKRRRQ